MSIRPSLMPFHCRFHKRKLEIGSADTRTLLARTFILTCFLSLVSCLNSAQDSTWLEVDTGGYTGSKNVFASKLDRIVAKLSDGDSEHLSGRALTRETADNFRCELARCVGHGGAITMGDSGTEGPFLAIYWDKEGSLWAAWRMTDNALLQKLSFGKIDGNEIRIHNRGGVVYTYVAEPGLEVEPLVAVALDLGGRPHFGVLSLGDFSCELPRLEKLPATLSHTFDLDLGQQGTDLTGDWTTEKSDDSLNGKFLYHPPGTGAASAQVAIHDLHEGSYDLWMNDHSVNESLAGIEVFVGGGATPSAFAVSQGLGDGLWLGLGRHQVITGASLSVELRRAHESKAPVSLDALHLLWSEWQDEDRDSMPDALGVEAFRMTGEIGSAGHGEVTDAAPHPANDSTSLTPGIISYSDGKGLAEGSKVTFYIDGTKGDDDYNGRSERVQSGPWHSSRSGPLRTIQKALDSVGDATLVEMYLSGPLELPSAGFRTNNEASFRVRAPGEGSVSLVSDQSDESLPPPAPFPSK